MLVTAKNVLDVARHEIGVTESPAGSNEQKYGAEFHDNGVAWCAIFTSWCFKHAGDINLIGGFDDYTVSMAQWFYNHQQWIEPYGKVQPGDVVFFHFGSTNTGRWKNIHHVGIVEGIAADGRIITIEGNTSVSSDDNGGAVMRRVRSRSGIAGFGRPKYAVAAAPVVPEKFYWVFAQVGDEKRAAAAHAAADGLGLTSMRCDFAPWFVRIHVRASKLATLQTKLKTAGIHGYCFETVEESHGFAAKFGVTGLKDAFDWYFVKGDSAKIIACANKYGLSSYALGSTGVVGVHARPALGEKFTADNAVRGLSGFVTETTAFQGQTIPRF